uniref:mRNA decay activator protein ZFP36L1-like n=1 Tax=Semicossyphus pulcher TaxID=241346 RepID=UPI0037E7D4DC
MTDTLISPLNTYTGVSHKINKMFTNSNSPGGPQLNPVPCPSASPTSGPPIGSLLDRRVVGVPSAGGLFHDSVSQSQFISSFRVDPSVPLGNNKENHVCERSLSEPGETLCVGGGGQVTSSRYKTELCRPFEEHGCCKYGGKCQFAHGVLELRSLSRHPKYKTEPCRTFHSAGLCPYGPRCHFIHHPEERRGPPPLPTRTQTQRPPLQHSFSFNGFSSCSPQDSPSSLTPPPTYTPKDLPQWHSGPLTLCGLLGPGLRPSPMSEPSPCFFHPPSESPPSPPDSVSDQEEGEQSSWGSHSGSDSPLLDASRRLPIFSRLSVSDD